MQDLKGKLRDTSWRVNWYPLFRTELEVWHKTCCEAADELERLQAEGERLKLQRFTVQVEQESERGGCHEYIVECHGRDDAMCIAFALDGGWCWGWSEKDASGMLELAKAYCDVLEPDQ